MTSDAGPTERHYTDSVLDPVLQKEQVKSIEQTKLTIKKRKGVAPFVRVFPVSYSWSNA